MVAMLATQSLYRLTDCAMDSLFLARRFRGFVRGMLSRNVSVACGNLPIVHMRFGFVRTLGGSSSCYLELVQ